MDATTTERFAELLRQGEDRILQHWTRAVATTLRGRLSEAEVAGQVREVFDAVRGAADAGGELSLDGPGGAEMRAVLGDLSRRRARHGFTATETAVSIFAFKEAVLSTMEALGAAELNTFVELSRFIDEMGLLTFETFAKARESLITEQAEQLLELSTPVVKLWEGVVALPLVGTLDSARAQVVMERLLQTLVDTGSPYAIIDITGVPAVDTQVAQHILKTVVAARLMGADCVISGIRPQIAQTIVALGIEFGDIVTKASLADALVYAVRAGGGDSKRQFGGRG